jgi:predicted metal-binding membrane protein
MMASLFALGAMSLVWMALITALVGAQKLLPWRRATLLASSALLLLLAIGLALAASSVPGLTVPGGPSAMHAMMMH